MVDDALDPGLPAGSALRDLATALARGVGVAGARDALTATAGPEAAAAAVGVCAVFAMMNRVVDAAGLPSPSDTRVARELGLAG